MKRNVGSLNIKRQKTKKNTSGIKTARREKSRVLKSSEGAGMTGKAESAQGIEVALYVTLQWWMQGVTQLPEHTTLKANTKQCVSVE